MKNLVDGMDYVTASYGEVTSSSLTEKGQKFVPFSFYHKDIESFLKLIFVRETERLGAVKEFKENVSRSETYRGRKKAD